MSYVSRLTGTAAVLSAVVGMAVFGSSAATTRVSAAATAPQSVAAGKFTAGLVTDVGGLNDKSFNHDAYLGLLEAEKMYGIKGDVVESHQQSDYVPNLTHFAQRHVNLTIAVGFLMESAIYQVAKEYPQQKFAIIDGAPTDAKGKTQNLPNVANLFFREQESGYTVGVIAGLMEKQHVGKATHNTIAYMGGISIPPVNRYIAGYVAGAQRVDPKIKILGAYSQSFTNQSAAKSIGLTQISKGADILFQVAGASGLGYLAAAQQRAVYGIGADANQGYLGQYVIASALKKVDVAVRTVINQTRNNVFKGGDHTFTATNGGTGFVVTGKIVPRNIITVAKYYLRQIARGKIVPPTTIPAH